MPDDTCSVTDCIRPTKRRGLCYGHYMKQWRYGTTAPEHPARHATDIVGQRFGHLVVTSERDGRHWVCDCDCGGQALATRDGLLTGMRVACGDRSVHYRTDSAGYYAAHDRVRRDRGKPAEHACVDCGGVAAEWSYNHDDPNELTSESRHSLNAPYSLESSHYSPRCVACHRRFDGNPIACRGMTGRISPVT